MTQNFLPSFQSRVKACLIACFGEKKANDPVFRARRFAEESAELCQASGLSREEMIQIVSSVFDREPGQPDQEAGGVLVTLSGLCSSLDFSMRDAGEKELARIIANMDKIRRKERIKSGLDMAQQVCPEDQGEGRSGYSWVVARASLRAAGALGLTDEEYAGALGIFPEAVEDLRSEHIALPEDQPAYGYAVDLIATYLRLSQMMGENGPAKSSWMRVTNTALKGVPAEIISRKGGAGTVLAYLNARTAP